MSTLTASLESPSFGSSPPVVTDDFEPSVETMQLIHSDGVRLVGWTSFALLGGAAAFTIGRLLRVW